MVIFHCYVSSPEGKLSAPAMSVAPSIYQPQNLKGGLSGRIDSSPNGSPAIFWLSKQIQVHLNILNLLPPGNVTKP